MLPGSENTMSNFSQILSKCLVYDKTSLVRRKFTYFSFFIMVLLVASVGISPTLSYSASLDSPRKQMLNGANSDEVLCNPGLTLMIQNNDKAACVTQSTAQKLSALNWGIIQNEFLVDSEQTTALINYRSIDESREKDGLAIIDLNPHSKTIGTSCKISPNVLECGFKSIIAKPSFSRDSSIDL